MHRIQKILEGYQRFRSGKYSGQAELYNELSHGQTPSIMLIGCADSRADPSDIFDAAPGQMFVVRNVANLVPPYQPDEGLHGVSAALEYAVKVLNVAHIVVMGHGGCGGVQAALSEEPLDDLNEFVAPWVALLDEARDKVKAQGSLNPQFALELECVNTSINNLMTFPFVREAVEDGRLMLHGSWFAIAHGELHWRNPVSGTFEIVPQGGPLHPAMPES